MPSLAQPSVAGGRVISKALNPAVAAGLTSMILMVLVCCSSPGPSVDSQTTLVRNRPGAETYRTMDFRLDFTYTFQAAADEASDSIQFNGQLVPRRGLYTLALRLHFLGDNGDILGTTVLYAPGAGRGAGRSAISREIDVPVGAVKIGFSHIAREQRIMPRRR